MNQISVSNHLPAVILSVIAELDPKGTNQLVSKAMSIVFEAFRLESVGSAVSHQVLLDYLYKLDTSVTDL